MSHESKEFRVGGNENTKRIMYLIKEFLLNRESIDLVAGTQGAPIVARAAEALVRLQYVTYEDIRTETKIDEGRRITRIVVRLAKAKDFAKKYEENEAKRKQFQDEKQNTKQ
jgi:hypothetical protein